MGYAHYNVVDILAKVNGRRDVWKPEESGPNYVKVYRVSRHDVLKNYPAHELLMTR